MIHGDAPQHDHTAQDTPEPEPEPEEPMLPCPFCGVHTHVTANVMRDKLGDEVAYVRCALCGCRGPRIVAVTEHESSGIRSHAIEEWNKRRQFEQRTAELLEANNREVGRRRNAEAEAKLACDGLEALRGSLKDAATQVDHAAAISYPDRCPTHGGFIMELDGRRRCGFVGCTWQQPAPVAVILPENRSQISDGYHTFDELYEHRHALFAVVCACAQLMNRSVWRSRLHDDGTMFPGWFIVGIRATRGKQIAYHLPERLWEKFDFVETLDRAPAWDGHTSDDVLDRLWHTVRTLTP